jgi:hypothetical protein
VAKTYSFSLGRKNVPQTKLDSQTEHTSKDERPGTEPKVTTQKKKKPTFYSPTEELKWKLNNARKKLITAKQYLKLAEKVSKKKKTTTQSTAAQRSSVKDIIRRAEIQVLRTGEKMGLSYMHYRRSV